mmetsp:Transcript_561/g.1043  ORF Transcript_561/g.1043 Transcript_561/m.1043 type:complete len:198 (-) Transcript_561:109-702(-)
MDIVIAWRGKKMQLQVVFVPNLFRHIGKGWREEDIVTGRVATLGRETVSLSVREQATLMETAIALEKEWGIGVEEQTFKFGAKTLSVLEDGPKALSDLGISAGAFLLLTRGTPKQCQEKMPRANILGIRERDPTRVLTTTTSKREVVEEEPRSPIPSFSGVGQKLGGNIRAQEAEFSAATRRALMIKAAERRALLDP